MEYEHQYARAAYLVFTHIYCLAVFSPLIRAGQVYSVRSVELALDRLSLGGYCSHVSAQWQS